MLHHLGNGKGVKGVPVLPPQHTPDLPDLPQKDLGVRVPDPKQLQHPRMYLNLVMNLNLMALALMMTLRRLATWPIRSTGFSFPR
jgi:hypothetical protein